MRNGFLLLAAALFAGSGSPAFALDLDLGVGAEVGVGSKAADDVVAGDSWNVRVCRTGTDAKKIRIMVGDAGAKNQEKLVLWKQSETQGDAVQVYELPDRFDGAERIWVKGKADDDGRKVRMAVFQGDELRKDLSFTGKKAAEVASSDTGGTFPCD